MMASGMMCVKKKSKSSLVKVSQIVRKHPNNGITNINTTYSTASKSPRTIGWQTPNKQLAIVMHVGRNFDMVDWPSILLLLLLLL